jgi:hypothetical protein
MNVQDTLNNLKTIGNQVIELQRQAKEARKAALEPFLEALAASGAVSIITVRGYTPGFNDGEPCEHSSDFWVNVKQHWHDEIDMTGEFKELFDDLQGISWKYEHSEEEDAANRQICADQGHVYDQPSDEIKQAIRVVIYDSIEEDYGTDYYVTFILKDGKFERHEGGYDCGY